MSTAYHPQTDGQTERVNQALEQYLRCYVDYNLDNWSTLLSTAEFAYNNVAHESTKESPFFVEYGRNPRAGPILFKETRMSDLSDIMRQRHEAQEQAKAALVLAAERMKWYYDKGVQNVPFKVGDKVLLNTKDYQTTERSLQPRYEGPFEIIEKLSPVTFKLNMPPRYRAMHPVFHASKLATYNEPTIPGQKVPPPPPIQVKGRKEWEVEQILQHREVGKNKKIQYLVRWKGYDRGEDTWEPEENLMNSKKLLQEYQEKNFAARQPTRRSTRKQSARELELDDEIIVLQQRDSTLQIELCGGKKPTRGSDEAAGYDLYAAETITITKRTRSLVNTGVKMRVPHGTYGRIAPRSGLSLKGIDIGAGVIDRDYTGEIRVLLVNTSDFDLKVQIGDRIAQIVLERHANCDIEIVDSLATTSRGDGGFGSTGT